MADFCCDICDLDFSFKSHLDRHLSSKSHLSFAEVVAGCPMFDTQHEDNHTPVTPPPILSPLMLPLGMPPTDTQEYVDINDSNSEVDNNPAIYLLIC